VVTGLHREMSEELRLAGCVCEAFSRVLEVLDWRFSELQLRWELRRGDSRRDGL